ncbi:hypothetical protein AB433_09400 [Croceicoccus naphthovorans]|uniref:DUF1570 domain-containing protein n=1 Tax=Croceicoccus naphthovorans TaxID=1348774 RepID=A0A0G3XHP5_9SPHN|nr:hypothetical protein AB433_09400 [Croceicoccus naphthovorans]
MAVADDWHEANTAHFRVFAEGTESDAEELAIKLERLDEAMRFMLNVPPDTVANPSARLTVLRTGDADDIAGLAGSRSSGIAGFFIPRAGESVAFVPAKEGRREAIGSVYRGRSEIPAEFVLFHEYAHYFMYQHAAASYPYWYSEGFAEVYSTLEFLPNGFILGKPPRHRDDAMQYLERKSVRLLLEPVERVRVIDVIAAYSMGWLLTHYLTFSPDREGQLSDYFSLLNQGFDSMAAAEKAFGDIKELDKDLDSYLRGRARGVTVTFDDYTKPSVDVRKLSEGEAARMSLYMRLKAGVDPKAAASLVDSARELATQYPSSAPVQLTATESFFDAQMYEEATAAAKRIIELEPDNLRARIFLARILLTKALEDSSQFEAARIPISEANRLQPNQPEALYLFYLSYRLSGQEVPEIALIALERANELAPFDENIRKSLAHLLLLEGRDKAALAVLNPLINDVERGKDAEILREKYTAIEEGNPASAIAYLAPSLPWLPPEKSDAED